MEVPDQRAQIWYALDYDCTDNLGRVPDVGVGIAPEVPFIFDIALILPACSYSGNDGYYHALQRSDLVALMILFSLLGSWSYTVRLVQLFAFRDPR